MEETLRLDKKFVVRMPELVHSRLVRQARKKHVSMNQIVIDSLRESQSRKDINSTLKTLISRMEEKEFI